MLFFKLKEKTYVERRMSINLEKAKKSYKYGRRILKEKSIPVPYILDSGKIIITAKDLQDMGRIRNLLGKLFPSYNFKFSKWCPNDNSVVLSWCDNKLDIDIWVYTTIEDDPTAKEDTKCKFVEVVNKSYSLQCEV